MYKEYIDKILYSAHRGKLGVVLAGTPLSIKEFHPMQFGSKWKEVGSKLQKEKNRKFIELIRSNPKLILGPNYEGSEVCVLCGSEAPEGKCEFCTSFEDLGDMIARQHVYLLEEFFKPYIPDAMITYNDVFAGLGYKIEFIVHLREIIVKLFLQSTKKTHYQIDPILLPTLHLLTWTEHSYFEELAARSIGDKMWGFCGATLIILAEYLRRIRDQHSISKAVALSRRCHYFSP